MILLRVFDVPDVLAVHVIPSDEVRMVPASPTVTKVPFPYLSAKGIVPLGTFGGKMRIVEEIKLIVSYRKQHFTTVCLFS